MKTIKNGTEVKRVDDKVAVKMVMKGWAYCPKSEWKKLQPKKASTELRTESPVTSDALPAKKDNSKGKDKKSKYAKKQELK
jgi:hypothetical protein